MKLINSTYSLDTALKNKSNNLQFLKFAAAISVIIAHSFPLSGNGEYDWLDILTSAQIDFGELAVCIFFLSGGILIAKSMLRLKTFKSYFTMRCIRILPLLMIVTVLSIILGAFLTNISLTEYFTSLTTYKYLLNGILLLQHNLPGVFENNLYISTVNGSLWTLPVEFLCYIACFIIYKTNNLKRKNIVFLCFLYIGIATCAYQALSYFPSLETLFAAIQPCYLFLLGMFFFIYRDKVILDKMLFSLSLFGTVLSFCFGLKYIAVWCFLPYVILYLAFMPKQCDTKWAILGNYSYSIYLCAFPIQQTITHIYGGKAPLTMHLTLSIIISIIVGVLFYHIFEKPISEKLIKKTQSN